MIYLFVVLTIFLPRELVWAEEISPLDFAAGYSLEVSGKGALFSLDLPEDVYRTVKRSDLGDLRVFNAEGEVLPHGFRAVPSAPLAGRTRENVPFFPLYLGWQGQYQNGMSIRVSRRTDGTIVNFDSVDAVSGDDMELIGYLFDMTNLTSVPEKLAFYWKDTPRSSVFLIRLEESDDLVHWTSLVRESALADLQYGGSQVEKKVLQLPRAPKKYLKLSWRKQHAELELTKVTSLSDAIPSHRDRLWVSLSSQSTNMENGLRSVVFTSRYHLPVDRVQVGFAQQNSLARISVQSRPLEVVDWTVRCEQLFYVLRFDEATVQNEPCVFKSNADQFWRLVVKEDGAGLDTHGKGVGLELGWAPAELLFVVRGSPPFLLAFGSGKLAQQSKPDKEMILQTLQSVPAGQSGTRARLGKRVVLGGEVALQPPPVPPPWEKWLLWAVLVVGVGVVALMTRSLIREMKATEKKMGQERE